MQSAATPLTKNEERGREQLCGAYGHSADAPDVLRD